MCRCVTVSIRILEITAVINAIKVDTVSKKLSEMDYSREKLL